MSGILQPGVDTGLDEPETVFDDTVPEVLDGVDQGTPKPAERVEIEVDSDVTLDMDPSEVTGGEDGE